MCNAALTVCKQGRTAGEDLECGQSSPSHGARGRGKPPTRVSSHPHFHKAQARPEAPKGELTGPRSHSQCVAPWDSPCRPPPLSDRGQLRDKPLAPPPAPRPSCVQVTASFPPEDNVLKLRLHVCASVGACGSGRPDVLLTLDRNPSCNSPPGAHRAISPPRLGSRRVFREPLSGQGD